jgi:hypothetical protein
MKQAEDRMPSCLGLIAIAPQTHHTTRVWLGSLTVFKYCCDKLLNLWLKTQRGHLPHLQAASLKWESLVAMACMFLYSEFACESPVDGTGMAGDQVMGGALTARQLISQSCKAWHQDSYG